MLLCEVVTSWAQLLVMRMATMAAALKCDSRGVRPPAQQWPRSSLPPASTRQLLFSSGQSYYAAAAATLSASSLQIPQYFPPPFSFQSRRKTPECRREGRRPSVSALSDLRDFKGRKLILQQHRSDTARYVGRSQFSSLLL